MESDRRTDKSLRGLAFSGVLRYATKFWIQHSVLPECLLGAVPEKTVFLTTPHKQLKCSLIYASFYDGHCQMPFRMHRITLLKSKTMELKAFTRYICGWFWDAQGIHGLRRSTISPPTLNLTSVQQPSSKCSINTCWMDNESDQYKV